MCPKDPKQKKSLYVLAPNDRFNYGDLLFPYIVTHYLGAFYDEVIYCSTYKSNLSKVGGLRTINHQALFEGNKDISNHLIIAGGECLFTDWDLILGYSSSFLYFVKRIIRKFRLSPQVYDRVKTIYLSHFYRLKSKYPFTIGKSELIGFPKICYNSVGGSYVLQDERLRKDAFAIDILSSADFISVRDLKTKEYLLEMGITCNLCADSAISMSNIFSEDFLLKNLSNGIKDIASQNYLFFQCAIHYVQEEANFAKLLKEFTDRYHLQIVLCPIGTARGHSDQIKLASIYNYLEKENSFLVKAPKIWDIMWLIKHSKMYIGSSLHGTITAMSFGVPFCSFGPKKLQEYIQTWFSNTIGLPLFSTEDQLFESASKVFSSHFSYNPTEQIESIERNFKMMRQALQE